MVKNPENPTNDHLAFALHRRCGHPFIVRLEHLGLESPSFFVVVGFCFCCFCLFVNISLFVCEIVFLSFLFICVFGLV